MTGNGGDMCLKQSRYAHGAGQPVYCYGACLQAKAVKLYPAAVQSLYNGM